MVTMFRKLTTAELGEGSAVGAGGSMLHQSAGLGLRRFVCLLLHSAAEHPGKKLGREVDALAKDSYGFTPLVSKFDL